MGDDVTSANAVQTAPKQAQPPVAHDSSIVLMIERAARDPNVDIDKMERLMAMQERMLAKAAEKAFSVAMRTAQAEMRPVSANAHNPQTKSKYATYDQLDKALRPIYTKHGFSLSFDEDDSPKTDHIRVVCYVAHDDGHTRTYRKDMPADGKGAKGGDVMTKTHAAGAAASYGARYLLKGIFNVAIGEDDRDGNDSPSRDLTDEQVADLSRLATATQTNLPKFLAIFSVERLEDISPRRFAEAKRILEERQRQRSAQ